MTEQRFVIHCDDGIGRDEMRLPPFVAKFVQRRAGRLCLVIPDIDSEWVIRDGDHVTRTQFTALVTALERLGGKQTPVL